MNIGEEGDGDLASVHLVSDSLATDGGYIAIGDMARILNGRSHRLIGGIAVMIHLQRRLLGPADQGDRRLADFGVPLGLLQDDALLVDLIEVAGYRKEAGNRWARQVDDRCCAPHSTS